MGASIDLPSIHFHTGPSSSAELCMATPSCPQALTHGVDILSCPPVPTHFLHFIVSIMALLVSSFASTDSVGLPLQFCVGVYLDQCHPSLTCKSSTIHFLSLQSRKHGKWSGERGSAIWLFILTVLCKSLAHVTFLMSSGFFPLWKISVQEVLVFVFCLVLFVKTLNFLNIILFVHSFAF